MAQFFVNGGVALSSGSTTADISAGGFVDVEAFFLRWLHSTGMEIVNLTSSSMVASGIDLESDPAITGANPTAINSAGTGFVTTLAGYRAIRITAAAGALVGQTATVSWQWNRIPFSVAVTIVP
jgi:hypothetical protein